MKKKKKFQLVNQKNQIIKKNMMKLWLRKMKFLHKSKKVNMLNQ